VNPRKPVCESLSETILPIHRGNAEAFELIYRTYSGFVHGICLRMLRDPANAEDVVQDTFVQLLRKIHTFRGDSKFSSWLYRLTTNVVLMRLRKRSHELSSLDEIVNDEDGSNFYSEIGGPDLHLAGLFDRINLEEAIRLLPSGYKRALILHDIQGYNHREIAKLLGHSTGNSKSQLHKARRRLRELLGDSPRSGLGAPT
jgi:RNA polymerase sigma-70 factor (ECF subfamily)